MEPVRLALCLLLAGAGAKLVRVGLPALGRTGPGPAMLYQEVWAARGALALAPGLVRAGCLGAATRSLGCTWSQTCRAPASSGRRGRGRSSSIQRYQTASSIEAEGPEAVLVTE
ncbi:hypothetical protein [Nannocystis pusilla]|uniref:hypothetical protein n=1 Tax=Nannocystis pusilla TaxID=889268 RepID=UPI003DA33B98